MKKVLVLSPHSDDELFGVGGTLLRHKKNKDEILACCYAIEEKNMLKNIKTA